MTPLREKIAAGRIIGYPGYRTGKVYGDGYEQALIDFATEIQHELCAIKNSAVPIARIARLLEDLQCP